MTRTVGVTGATGFIGGLVARAIAGAGYRVVALGRRATTEYEHRPYDLAQPVSPGIVAGFDAVVHCAYDLKLTDQDAVERINVDGTRALAQAASQAGTRLILVSSMSAYAGTQQTYGRAKLRSERDVLDSGGEAVRLGLVWGGSEGGMIGTLKRLAVLPIVPRLRPNLVQFTLCADDVGPGILKLIDSPRCGKPLGLAHPEPVPFERIVSTVGGGRRHLWIPIPWQVPYMLMRLAEKAGVNLPVRSDSLLGLVKPAPNVPNVEFWARNGLRLKPFQ